MEEKWMAVFPDMKWYEAAFERKDDGLEIKILKTDEVLEGKIVSENQEMKVVRVKLSDGSQLDLADFKTIDDFFEKNNVNFKNRKGLHKEIRRYIDFSLT